jgi:hypothetical protein
MQLRHLEEFHQDPCHRREVPRSQSSIRGHPHHLWSLKLRPRRHTPPFGDHRYPKTPEVSSSSRPTPCLPRGELVVPSYARRKRNPWKCCIEVPGCHPRWPWTMAPPRRTYSRPLVSQLVVSHLRPDRWSRLKHRIPIRFDLIWTLHRRFNGSGFMNPWTTPMDPRSPGLPHLWTYSLDFTFQK